MTWIDQGDIVGSESGAEMILGLGWGRFASLVDGEGSPKPVNHLRNQIGNVELLKMLRLATPLAQLRTISDNQHLAVRLSLAARWH